MELSFILYIFSALITIPGIFFVLAVMNKFTAAIIATIGTIIIFVLFGVQTYSGDGKYREPVTVVDWPPSINYCPDYLSLFTKSDGTQVCVDTVGVASRNEGNAMQKFVPSSSTAQPSGNQIFNLYLKATDYPAGKSLEKDADRKELIIEQCKERKVTWEGIWDGITAYNKVVPKPPTPATAATAATA